MNRLVKVGSRESRLAVRQAEIVMDAIKKDNPHIQFELITIKTKGDKILNKSLDKIGGKGLFIKELEQSLLNMEIDIAVHSYKDMPYEETDDLPIVALSKRESPFDALILPISRENSHHKIQTTHTRRLINGEQLVHLPIDILPVGSSSLRRSIQLKSLYKGIETTSVRGNVITRLSKLDSGQFSAIILAEAGLIRLGLQNRISKIFTPDEMIPSASQGILAVQGRANEDYSYLSKFHNLKSEKASMAERQFLRTLGGNCSSPVAAYAEIHGNEIMLRGMYVGDENRIEKGFIYGCLDEGESLGEKLAIQLKNKAVEGW